MLLFYRKTRLMTIISTVRSQKERFTTVTAPPLHVKSGDAGGQYCTTQRFSTRLVLISPCAAWLQDGCQNSSHYPVVNY